MQVGVELIWVEIKLILYNILSYMLTLELTYGTLGRDFGRLGREEIQLSYLCSWTIDKRTELEY